MYIIDFISLDSEAINFSAGDGDRQRKLGGCHASFPLMLIDLTKTKLHLCMVYSQVFT
jgi:hypothetical protein